MGGVWKYTPETEDDVLGRDPSRRRVHSSMYKGLRTNLPRVRYEFAFKPIQLRSRQNTG